MSELTSTVLQERGQNYRGQCHIRHPAIYSPDRWHSSQIYDNGVAGIHIIVDTTDFTFEATFDTGLERGDGYVGSVDGRSLSR